MTEHNAILAIDDDPMFLRLIENVLRGQGYEPHIIDHYPSETETASLARFEAILLDWDLDGQDGLTLLSRLRRSAPAVPVIMVTGRDKPTESAVRAIQAGAFDFVPKPVDPARLFASLTKAVENRRLLRVIDDAAIGGNDALGLEGMVGHSPQMRTIFDVIRRVAPTDVSVMIAGESGTGKELVAHAIHRRSKRAKGPFVAVNMAALPKELVESTLFGHERGAFTGADRQRPGVAEEADGGTLFLDELCEMPLELQPKLLRFLQERVFRRVGGSKDLTADVRVVSATNRDPAQEVRQGRLRADLYYRLNVIPIELPPVRSRDGDVPLLAMHALRTASAKHEKSFTTIDPDAMAVLARYDWPGNVRQLYHVIERCVVLGDGAELRADALPGEVRESNAAASAPSDLPLPAPAPPGPVMTPPFAPTATPAIAAPAIPLKATPTSPAPPAEHFWPSENAQISSENMLTMDEIERRAIAIALRLHAGSPSKAARTLGISEATIFRKIKTYGLNSPAPSKPTH